MTEFGSGGAGAQGLPARCAGILNIPCSKVVSLCSTNGNHGNQSVSYWYSAIPLPPIEGSQELCCLKICSTGLASYAQCSLETQSKSGIFRCSGPKSLGTSLKAKHCAVHESNSFNDFRVLVTPGHEANMNLVNLVKLKKLTKRFRQRVLLVWICISRRFVGLLNLNVQFANSFQWFWSCILHGVFVSFETGSSEHSDLENVQNGPGAWCHAMSTHC